MKCPSEIELNEYAEGRLTTERRWDVQRHLNDCPGCRTDLEGLTWATAVMDALHDDDQPEEVHPSPEDLAAMKERRLPPVRRAEIIAHLGTCPECAHIYGALPQAKAQITLLRHWQPLAAAAGILLAIAVAFFGMQNGMVSVGQAPQAVVREAQPPATEPQPVAKAPATPGAAQEKLQAEAATEPAAPAPGAPAAASAANAGSSAASSGTAATRSATASENVPAGRKTAPPPPPRQRRGGDETPAAPRPEPPPPPRIVALDGSRAPAPSAPVAEAFADTAAPTPPPPAPPVLSRNTVRPAAATAPPPPPDVANAPKALTPPAPATTGQMPRSPGFRPAMATPSRAGTEGVGALSTETARSSDTVKPRNKLKFSRAQLLSVRNDPQAKAKIKAELRDMLEQEQSELGQKQIRLALELLDAPLSKLAAKTISHPS